MESWGIGGAVVVLLVVLPLLWLFARRRWLSQRGGLFDCGLRPGDGSRRWALGFGRYEGNELEWYRAFGLTLSPARVIDRRATSFSDRREPEGHEVVELLPSTHVVRLTTAGPGRDRAVELAMSPSSVTGLLSWLEAAPPGAGYAGVG